MVKTLKTILVSLLICGLYLHATETSQEKNTLIKELFKTIQLEELLNKNIQSNVDMQIQNSNLPKAYANGMKKFFKKYINYKDLEPKYIEIYANIFSKDEIKELIRFYSTPTGTKLALNTNVIFLEASKLGLKIVKEHTYELRQMIENERKKEIK